MGYANNLDWTDSTLAKELPEYRKTTVAEAPIRRLRSGGFTRVVGLRPDGRWNWVVRPTTAAARQRRRPEKGIEDTIEWAMFRAEEYAPHPGRSPIRPPSGSTNAAAVRAEAGTP